MVEVPHYQVKVPSCTATQVKFLCLKKAESVHLFPLGPQATAQPQQSPGSGLRSSTRLLQGWDHGSAPLRDVPKVTPAVSTNVMLSQRRRSVPHPGGLGEGSPGPSPWFRPA